MNKKDVVIYIDEEEDARDTYGLTLQQWFGEEVELIAIEPERDLATMIEKLGEYPNLVSLVIDQRLHLSGQTDYKGSQLADAFRVLHGKLPIYIFTNHPGDFISNNDPRDFTGPGSVEYILSKDDGSDDEKEAKNTMRLRRHINVYKDIVDTRLSQLDALIRKSISSALSEEEKSELEEINLWRMRPILSSESLGADALKRTLDDNEKILAEIQKKLAE